MKTLDVTKLVGAVTRAVRTDVRDGRPTNVVTATRVYDTDQADLWDAITSAQRIPRWLMPIEGELRLGGRYQLVGNAGGTITTCDRPSHLAVTWEYGGGVSWVDARLEQVSAKQTRLVIEHAAHPDDHWSKFGPGAVGVGWDMMLLGLGLHLESGEAVTEEGMKWAMSDEGKRFTALASTDWGRAAIAAGTDEAVARAAAEATTAAYTGAA